MSPARLNVGCGASPTPSWVNYDNSLTVRLANAPALIAAATKVRLISPAQARFATVAREAGIRHANAVRRIPHADNSVEIVYSSHMLEHLERPEARRFLEEALRVLQPGGILRLAVPDLKTLVDEYVSGGDADTFLERTYLPRERPRRPGAVLRWLLVGDREHSWMYDGSSLGKLLAEIGFDSPIILPSGETTIADPGELNLCERSDESVYVEARKPIGS